MGSIYKSPVNHFINLTSGLEWLRSSFPHDYQLTRIQSTACEQKLWSGILDDLDYNLLLALARGEKCILYDASAQKPVSRAIYQGIPWITYACERIWFGRANTPRVRQCDVTAYFSQCYGGLSQKTLNKLRYVRKFVDTDQIRFAGRCIPTKSDGAYDELKEILNGYSYS